ncbi:autophagy protein Atg22 [Colletotrichum phormii]|uniref:Autophagy-related protein n=1 Tax=Colletotrichum phormii TaxID=359342 RepID=A0AAI9ZQT1_9PEZI|nr:autophagy protein Atg22 [Colletotrichum phormii]KAK1636507.1 autophagy protein Atg22 [Colletotrichum phormii]
MVPRQEQHARPPPAPRLWSRLSTLSKRSFRSFTSDFEADDERSDTDSDYFDRMSGSSSDGFLHGPGRYKGEDTRPTSQKELSGWYAYAFAAETYVICGSFIPILLETLARENGVLLSDRTTPCGTSDSKNKTDGQCVVYPLGIEINTASFAMYTFSISVLLQVLLVVSVSSAADHGNSRKKLLLTFAWVGSFSVMAYIFVNKTTYLLGALLAIISNTCFGASFVLLNSFLPLLVRHHPEVIASETVHTPDLGHSDLESRPLNGSYIDEDSAADDIEDQNSALLGGHGIGSGNGGYPLVRKATHEELTSVELQLSTQISAKGIGIGYIAGLFVQCVAIAIVIALKNTTWSQRVALSFCGLWWAIFTIPAAMWLRPRPGPPMPITSGKGIRAWPTYVAMAWKSLFNTVRLARRLRDIVLFLCAWFLVSDAIATTSSTAILFAKTQLHMKPWALGMINVISTIAGVIGAFSWAFISRKFNLKPHQTILVCIGLFELIPIYGLLGYLPIVQRWGVIGLQQPWEMYPLAAVYGLVLGGLSSYCRSLYGELIPEGSEAAFYALYAASDKGSSVFGPTIVGAIIDQSGDIRPAFWFLAALVGLPAPLIWSVNVERGKREGQKLAETIEGFKSLQGETGSETEDSDDRPILSAYDDDEEEVEHEHNRTRGN